MNWQTQFVINDMMQQKCWQRWSRQFPIVELHILIVDTLDESMVYHSVKDSVETHIVAQCLKEIFGKKTMGEPTACKL